MILSPNVAIIFKPISFSFCFLFMNADLYKFAASYKLMYL